MLAQRSINGPGALVVALIVGFAGLPTAIGQDQQPAGAPVAALRGRVTNKAGAPLPGARVRVAIPAADMRFVDSSTAHLQVEARTDANGDYRMELPGIARRTTISIDAMMPGFRRLVGTLMAGGDARRIEVEPGQAAEANLALEPARYFGGIVVDEQGQPIRAVKISANYAFDRGSAGVERVASQPDGSFEIFNYSGEPRVFGDRPSKGTVFFTHPDYVDYRLEDVYAIEPDRRSELRIVLPTGHRVAGTVLDVAGKAVPRALVEAVLDAGSHRKATLTDADGRFALRGLVGGPTTLAARSLEIKQKARLPMVLDGDKDGLEVRLQTIVLPADLKAHSVLGMQLADVTPELKSAYDLALTRGALILDPGRDSGRLKIGELAEGNMFFMVGNRRIGSVREFVDQILEESGGRDAAPLSVRVVYTFLKPEFVGTNTQYMALTKDDIQQLQALSDRLKAEAR